MISPRFLFLTLICMIAGTAIPASAVPNTVQFQKSDYSVAEDDSGSVTLTVTATRRGDANERFTVHYETSDGTAKAPGDYSSDSGTITFGPGEVEKSITVGINNDPLLEDSEGFSVELSSPSALATIGSPATATVTISDDDAEQSTVKFTSANYTANEGGGTAIVTVIRSGGLGLKASVTFSTQNGTADGTDYTPKADELISFAPGQTSKEISVALSDDELQEGEETFEVTLHGPTSNATIGEPDTATVTLTDNDDGSTVEFAPNDYSVNEASDEVTLFVRASRLGEPNTTIKVDYASADGSAIHAQDYTAVSGTLTFGPGETQKPITVPITDDNLLEELENFSVKLSNPDQAVLKADDSREATVSISDDDSGESTVEFTSTGYSANEGDGPAVVTVARSGGLGSSAAVSFSTQDGSADSSDYTPKANGTVSFAPGETSKKISIAVTDDQLQEDAEDFKITLHGPTSNATISQPDTATVTLIDNDAGSTVEFTETDYSVNETSGQITLLVRANRLGNPNSTITVDYTSRDGSAIHAQDYTAVNGTVTFGPGETQKAIHIHIVDDSKLEALESFFVDLHNPAGASLKSDDSRTARVNISDDDSGTSTISFTRGSTEMTEGQESATLAIARSGGTQSRVTIRYRTSDGTATAGKDYTGANHIVTFEPGELKKIVQVPIIDDSFIEEAETFTATLSEPGPGAALGSPSTETITIGDNDGGGNSVRFVPTSETASESAGGTQPGQVTLTLQADRTGNSKTVISVDYATRNGSAAAGQDYRRAQGTVVFNAGETQKQIVVQLINDNLIESAERFFVDLSNPTGARLPADRTATVNIADDDGGTSTLQFSAPDYPVKEGVGSARLTVIRSGGVALVATASYKTADGTATAPADYATKSSTVSFAPGEYRKDILVPVKNDSKPEPTEAFSVLLSNPGPGATLGAPNTASVTINDNEPAPVITSPDSASGTAGEPFLYQIRATNSPTSYDADRLPPGFNIDKTSGIISGRTDFAGTYDVIISATNPAGTGSKTIFITIHPPRPQITSSNQATGEQGQPFRYQITATNKPTSYGATGLPAGVIVNEETGVISGRPTVSGEFDAQIFARNGGGTGSGSLRIRIAPAPPVITSPATASGTESKSFSYRITATNHPDSFGAEGLPPDLAVSSATGIISGTPTQRGTYSVLVFARNESGTGSKKLKLTINPPTPAITSPDNAKGQQNVPFSYQITATNDPTSYGANGLPAGLSVNTSSGLISGTPKVSGNFNVQIFAKNGGGTGTLTLHLTVTPAGTTLVEFHERTYDTTNSASSVTLVVDLSRAAGDTGPFSVKYSTLDGLAKAGQDYQAESGTVDFATGQTQQTITISLIPQSEAGADRTFSIQLSGQTRGVIGRDTATVAIAHPDLSTKVLNISTRGPVKSGEQVMIAGFIIQGSSQKQLVLRGLGPSLTQMGVPSAISDPSVELRDANGAQIAYNDDYASNSEDDRKTLANHGLTPTDSSEAAIVATVSPGTYTAVLRGQTNGVGLVETYDISGTAASRLVNISTRGQVDQGDNGAMIGGFIVGTPGNGAGTSQRVVLRAMGPSLQQAGVEGTLADTTLDLYRGSDLILSNDNWRSNSAEDQQTLQNYGLAPANDSEAALVTNLDPGSYSAVVRGKNNTTGIALVELYQLPSQ